MSKAAPPVNRACHGPAGALPAGWHAPAGRSRERVTFARLMDYGPRQRHPRLHRATFNGAVALALSQAPAIAQVVADDPTTLATVEVTGSHLRRVEQETAQPLLVLDRDQLLQTGLSNVGEILQQLPQHGSDLNSDYNNGGNGETRVDLRNLGAVRTLVLLNGHRYVSSLDGAVDVGSVPLPIVERIEVLTDGASAIYGSDAIAGVVNIITRDSYDGVEFNLYYAGSEHGDGERRGADITWGRSGARGGVVVNLSFVDQQPIWAGDRAISAVPTFGLPSNDQLAGASTLTPDGRFGFGPGGNLLPDGTTDGQLTWDRRQGGYRAFDPRNDSYNFAPGNYLRTPYERTALFAQANYELSDRLLFRSELLLHRRQSSQELAPTPIVQFAAGDGAEQRTISSDSIYNPFGQPVTFFSLRPVGRKRRFEQDVQTHYLSLGVEGAVQLGRRGFDWDLNVIDGRTHEERSISGGYDLVRLALGIGPSFRDADGTPRCGTSTGPVSGCVPLDFLHGQDGLSGAMLASISAAGALDEVRKLRDLTVGISGDLADLPAGPLAIAAGMEYRSESDRIDLDPLLADDSIDFGANLADAISGSVRAREAYVEVNLPLLAHQPFAHALEASVAARYSDYSTFGTTRNYKLGIAWRPVADWLVRATWSQGYRAPSVSELFAFSASFQAAALDIAGLDPCVDPPTQATAERCQAAGVPAGGFDPQMGPSIRSGSNPDLQPERSRNRTLGLVWSPAAIAGLDLSLDWWRIELHETIDEIPDFLLPWLCYVDAVASACEQLRRDASTGVLTDIDARRFNYGAYEVEGYDLSLSYRWQAALGDFRLGWDTVYLSQYLKEIPKGSPSVSAVGNFFLFEPAWRIRSLLSLDWSRQSLGATVRLRYFSALDESCEKPAGADHIELCDRPDFQSPSFFGAPEHIVDAVTYTDLQWRWEPHVRTQISIGVNNLFDHGPPVSYVAFNSYDPSYDIPGRMWYVNWRQRF